MIKLTPKSTPKKYVTDTHYENKVNQSRLEIVMGLQLHNFLRKIAITVK